MDVAFCRILCVEYHVRNEQKHCAVVIVKRAAGCTENQGGHGQANRQHLFYFFNQVEIPNMNLSNLILSKFSAIRTVILISVL